MAIDNIDYTQVATLSPMVMTDTLSTLFTNIISNITADTASLATFTGETTTKFNEVISTVNTIKAGYGIDIEGFQDTISKILDLESENPDGEHFVKNLQIMYDEMNRREETLAFTIPVTDAPEGKFGLDLSAYNFKTLEDYQVKCQVTTVAGEKISASFKKDSITAGTVTLRDEERFQGIGLEKSFYNPSDADSVAVEVVVYVIRTAVSISGKATEVDGDEALFGDTATVYPEAITVTSGALAQVAQSMVANITSTNSVEGSSYVEVTAMVGANGESLTVPADKNNTKFDVNGSATLVFDADKAVMGAALKVANVSAEGVEQLVTQEVTYTYEGHSTPVEVSAYPYPALGYTRYRLSGIDFVAGTGATVYCHGKSVSQFELGKGQYSSGNFVKDLSISVEDPVVSQKWDAQNTFSVETPLTGMSLDTNEDTVGVNISQTDANSPLVVEVINGTPNAVYTVYVKYSLAGTQVETFHEVFTASGTGNFESTAHFPEMMIPNGSGGLETVDAYVSVTRMVTSNTYAFSSTSTLQLKK